MLFYADDAHTYQLRGYRRHFQRWFLRRNICGDPGSGNYRVADQKDGGEKLTIKSFNLQSQ